jgi:carnitine 3-dehydrogenase
VTLGAVARSLVWANEVTIHGDVGDGQFMNANLGGGDAGIKHLLEHLGPAIKAWWADHGRIEHVTPQMAEKAEAGINEILRVHTASDIAAARDNVLLQTLKATVADKRLPY